MPTIQGIKDTPADSEVTVRSITAYGTLWTRFFKTTKHKLLSVFFFPFFITTFSITLLTNEHIILLIDPKLMDVQISSTSENQPDSPIAYKAKSEYISKYEHPVLRTVRLLTFCIPLCIAYIKQENIAYLVSNTTSKIPNNQYLITSDEDSLRPYILFR